MTDRPSITDPDAPEAETASPPNRPLGRAFAEALARKDFAQIEALLHPEIDFRALTPGRMWEPSGAQDVLSNVLRRWFGDFDDIEELVRVETDSIADRQRVAYRFRGHNPDGPFVLEQQAYFSEHEGRITWMRVLCSGFRPA